MNQFSLLLQSQSGGGMSGMLMIIAMIVIFYFVMIRPQSKKQKELKRQREAMKNGDKVVTAGGIHGKIKDMTDATIILEVAPGMCIKVDRASVYPLVEEAKTAKPQKSKKEEKAEKAEKTED